MSSDITNTHIDALSDLLGSLPAFSHLKLNHIHNVEFRSRWSLPIRTLEDFILTYIRDGSGFYNFPDEDIPFGPGHIFIISPGVTFSATGSDHTPSLLSVRFTKTSNISSNDTGSDDPTNSVPNDKKKNPSTDRPFYIHYDTEQDEQYRTLFYDLYSLFLKGDMQRSENALITLILDRIHDDLTRSTNRPDYDLRLESARVYIKKNIQDHITLESLAEISNLSLPYFSKKFKQQYGTTPKSYIFESRMKYARMLLTDYHYSVKEVADMLHYSDMYIFSNQFKKHWGYAPSKAVELRF